MYLCSIKIYDNLIILDLWLRLKRCKLKSLVVLCPFSFLHRLNLFTFAFVLVSAISLCVKSTVFAKV